MEANNMAAIHETLKTIHDKINALDEECAVDPVEIRDIARAALAKPARNCDKFRDVDEAYNQFMRYVKRENPTCTKSSPLYTVYDALKWALDGENMKGDER